eukprot:m.308558 g.308558  ORF g.308558 m.308558 type:complete len:265 (+) comp44226_c0_seq1:68-862(+)
MENIAQEGYLEKEGGGAFSRWQKRWFRLTSRKLSWHTSKPKDHESALQAQGSVAVAEIASVEKLVGDRAGRQNCFTLHVTGKKVYQLSAGSSEERDVWVACLKQLNPSHAKEAEASSGLKFVTVEAFSSHGLRVTGEPENHILAELGAGLPKEKKRSDERGWFCDRHTPLGQILNVFSLYGWELDRSYQSESVSSIDNTVQSCNVAVFCKGKKKAFSYKQPADKHLSLPKQKANQTMIEGADEELAELMAEFNIPLDLLYAASS